MSIKAQGEHAFSAYSIEELAKINKQKDFAEVAFLGRSNVGKSSLINNLLQNKKLAKTSGTPGKTQAIHFYRVNKEFLIADLPGYGFAKVPTVVRKKWIKLVENFLSERESVKLFCFLFDIRRKVDKLDLQLMHFLEQSGKPYLFIMTKIDKVKTIEKKRNAKQIFEGFEAAGLEKPSLTAYYSVKQNSCRNELFLKIKNLLEEPHDHA